MFLPEFRFFFWFFLKLITYMETIRGPKVRRRSRTDSGSGQLIVPPLRVLFTLLQKLQKKNIK